METEPLQLHFVSQLLASGRDGEGGSPTHTRGSHIYGLFGPECACGVDTQTQAPPQSQPDPKAMGASWLA